ncbi:LysR family transcriptional regulator [Marinomonas spartinae]|uniref:LysR family transcriptional regulator n=1 Tax=Marinomonas spartinae TaxID=1792290 RepID=UPI0018F1FAA8|nr:LysR family transcriptional regulator [Marinomonas spartinae]MBJ7553954.1 LysR family transcriptional regulator [Marinomonas spartinae]
MKLFNPRSLEFLNAIDRYGSLRKAANKLNVDPSAISRSITLLEDQVSTPVWERNNASSIITPAGKELLSYYRTMQASEAATLSRIQDYRELRTGEINIAIGEGFITDLITSSLQSFLEQYPGIQLSVEMAGAKEALQLLEDDQIDFAVTYASPNHINQVCHIETLHPLDVIAPYGHPLTTLNRPIEFQEVENCSMALINQSTGMGRLVALAEETENVTLTPRLRTNSVAVLKHFVSSGAGISFMPRLTVKNEVETNLITIIETSNVILSHAKSRVISKKGRELTVPAQELINHLQLSASFLKNDAPIVLNK